MKFKVFLLLITIIHVGDARPTLKIARQQRDERARDLRCRPGMSAERSSMSQYEYHYRMLCANLA